jgi:hypothetical protein
MGVSEVFEVLIPVVGVTNVVLLLMLLAQAVVYVVVIRPEQKQWRRVMAFFSATRGVLTADLMKLAGGADKEGVSISFVALMNNVRNSYMEVGA